ncbi:MAG: thiol reductant ABC exporter subunit CydC [Gammaproteobacteria bacterium]
MYTFGEWEHPSMKDLGFILKLFVPYRMWLVVGLVMSLVASLTAIGLLTLSGWFITASALAGLLAADAAAFSFNFLVPAAQIRALAIGRTLGRYAERLVTHEATFRVLAEIRSWFFQKLIPLAPGRLSLLRSGDLLSRMTADIDALDAMYLRLLAPMVVAALGGGAVIMLLHRYSPQISALVLVAIAFASIGGPWIFNRLGRKGAEHLIVWGGEYRTVQIDMIQGMADLLAGRAFERSQAGLSAISDNLIGAQRSNNRLAAYSSAFTLWFSQATVLCILLLGAEALQEAKLSGPGLALVVFCTMASFELTAPLPKALQMLGKMQKAAGRIRNAVELSPTIIEPEQPMPLPERYDLAVDQVCFRYSRDREWVLRDVSMSIPQGNKVAIIGPSGSGKTTLLQLLMRYYEPEQGRIELAGQDYRQFRSDQLMTSFAVLSQRSHLFAATIKENLLLVKPMATELELMSAIEAVGLGKLIRALPEGLDTWVGENGLRVSGGEARRIALARLYLKNAPILFLDEPTEGLDTATEKDVLTALGEFSKHKTVVMVTHRQAGLDLVDRVFKMEQTTLARVR